MITLKTLKHDSAQKARDARRKIFQEREVLIVHSSDWKIEATPQIGFSQQNHRCFNIYRTECYTMLNKGDIRKAMDLASKLCQFTQVSGRNGE
jgi:hypothetical protein